MNIFWFNTSDLADCARCHPDKLLIKMAMEHTQLLAQALLYYDKSVTIPKKDGSPYKATHVNHPCAIWARQNRQNFVLLCNLTLELCIEYEKRFGKPSSFVLPVKEALSKSYIIPEAKADYIQNYPVAINEFWLKSIGYKKEETKAVDANLAQTLYREYLKVAKCHYSYWKNTQPPIWWHRQDGNGRMFCPIKVNHKTTISQSFNDNYSHQGDNRAVFEEMWKLNCDVAEKHKISKISKANLLKIAVDCGFDKQALTNSIDLNKKEKAVIVNIPDDLEAMLQSCNKDVKKIRSLLKTIINKKVPTNKTLSLWVLEGNLTEKIKDHLEYWIN